MCTSTECTRNTMCLMNWPEDGSMSRNMLPDLQIDNKIICCDPTEYNNTFKFYVHGTVHP